MYYHDHWYYKKLTPSKKDRYTAFIYYLRNELRIVTKQVFAVLSRGYDEMVSKDRDAYYNSAEYKKAKEKQDAEKKKNSGINNGIEHIHQKLGYWVPAKRPPGAHYHITYSTPDFDDELKYEAISLHNYVAGKAAKLAVKYNSSTLAGMIFTALADNSPCFNNSEDFHWFCYKHFEDEAFDLKKHLPELYEVFPKAIEKGKITLDRIPVVENGDTVSAFILQNKKYTTFNIDLDKYPSQKTIVGKKMGDTFELPNIDLIYRIEFIY